MNIPGEIILRQIEIYCHLVIEKGHEYNYIYLLYCHLVENNSDTDSSEILSSSHYFL